MHNIKLLSILFTIFFHLFIIILLYGFSSENKKNIQKPISISARILKKGIKTGVNNIDSKDKSVRTKKKKYLPDKIKNKISKKIKKLDNKLPKKEIKKKISSNVKKLAKENKKNVKKNKNKNDKVELDTSTELLSALNDINPSILSKNDNKKGGLGRAKGDEAGFEDGSETDPSKAIATSLYERRIAIKIKNSWKHQPIEDIKGIVVVVRLLIEKDGSFKYKILKKSRNSFFNDSVISVLKKIKKVEEAPKNFQDYYKNKGMLINFFPKK